MSGAADPQSKWDRRYRAASEPNPPAQVLVENAHLLPRAGRALELACGLGGNALWLAARGLDCSAWDLSPVAIAKLQGFAAARQVWVQTAVVDLSRAPLPESSFDLICISRFLERDLCPAIERALKPGGLLCYQTFTREGRGESGPGNPAYLLAPGELLGLFPTLEPIAYREERDCGDLSRGLRGQAYLVGRRPRTSGSRP